MMKTDRRNWLKKMGLCLTGLRLSDFKNLASPATQEFIPKFNNPIRLHANENPYGTSPLAKIAMSESISKSNAYAWELSAYLVDSLAKKHNLLTENVLIDAGSIEVLDLIVQLAAQKKGNFVLAEPTFNYWEYSATKLGLSKIAVPLTADKKHDLLAMQKAINEETRLVYICNPNNPTGTTCEQKALENFINETTKKTLVMIDEAYLDFTSLPSMSSLVNSNKNLIVVKTFSKIYGMAGARIGYALANSTTIEQLNQFKTSVNGSVSVVSAAGALAALNDNEFVKKTLTLNNETRKFTLESLNRLGFTCIPSSANFIYFSLENYKKDFFEQLKQHHILGTKLYEEKGKWTRITIGTMAEMQTFIKALE